MKIRKQEKKNENRFEFSSIMPVQFNLLCKLMEIEPRKVIYDFMCNAGMEGYSLGDAQRLQAMEYFICCGYGQEFYTEAEVRKIMKEIEAIGSLFPRDGRPDLIDIHSRWRSKYEDYWFEKWYWKVRRRPVK